MVGSLDVGWEAVSTEKVIEDANAEQRGFRVAEVSEFVGVHGAVLKPWQEEGLPKECSRSLIENRAEITSAALELGNRKCHSTDSARTPEISLGLL